MQNLRNSGIATAMRYLQTARQLLLCVYTMGLSMDWPLVGWFQWNPKIESGISD